MPDRTSTGVRFRPEVHARLKDASKAHGLTVNYLVNKAVEDFLDRLLEPSEVRLTRRVGGPDQGQEEGRSGA